MNIEKNLDNYTITHVVWVWIVDDSRSYRNCFTAYMKKQHFIRI